MTCHFTHRHLSAMFGFCSNTYDLVSLCGLLFIYLFFKTKDNGKNNVVIRLLKKNPKVKHYTQFSG